MRRSDGTVRAHYQGFAGWLDRTTPARIAQKRDEAERAFHRVGITFAVYGEDSGTERLIPFDIVPRIIPAEEWKMLDRGLRQRVQALNAFLHDIYHDQAILDAGVMPRERVLGNAQYRRGDARHRRAGRHLRAHRRRRHGARGRGRVLRARGQPARASGVSYMLENRKMMMRLFPELFATQPIRPVEHYPDLLLENLRALAPAGEEAPDRRGADARRLQLRLLRARFLAQQMGVELVEGQDLFVQDDTVYMRTTRGPQRVDVIYRRIDDDFLDPLAFRPDSMLGVPGLFAAYRAGRVTLANAIGTGVADDKSIYPYVPDMIRFYLGEEPMLNNVPT